DLDGKGVATEGRAKPDAERTGKGSILDVDTDGVDPGRRQEFVRTDPEVGGWETKIAPALEPVLHRRADDVVPTQQLGRRPNLPEEDEAAEDRKSTRLNSSHRTTSYAVFCLKKKNTGWRT